MASRPRSLAVTKISKISESPDIWVITILRELQRHIKFSTNFAVTICQNSDAHTMVLTIVCGRREKVSTFSLFVCALSEVVKTIGFLCTKKPLNFIVMSLWDWLLAAWIYEEIFDDDSNDRSCDDTRDNDSSYDYDDYEEDFNV